ncbi:hypothetical protein [Desulfosediminicola flagellatus]|nr:hypothetical protein [Desulfosediminicola flagellatus]
MITTNTNSGSDICKLTAAGGRVADGVVIALHGRELYQGERYIIAYQGE